MTTVEASAGRAGGWRQAARARPAGWVIPLCVGVATSLFFALVWGGLRQTWYVHDEAAYVLQARIFAAGQWAAEGRPLPEFFEQYHVLVTPKLAPKYFPGHAILMVPGIWVGLPGLMPVILLGASGALLFALASRATNAWVGLLTWILWLTAPGVVRFLPSYLSESTSTFAWLSAWYALVMWRATHRQRWLLIVAAAVGLLAITRPFTAVALALPIAVVVVPTLLRQRAWRNTMQALLVGSAFLALLPVWSWRTTGSWRVMPYTLYSALYFPYDRLGFGDDSTPPQRQLPPDMRRLAAAFRRHRQPHTVRALPATLVQRSAFVLRDMVRSRWYLVPLLALGCLALTGEAAFALASALLLLLAYSGFGHAMHWSVYYVEAQTVLAFLCAVGAWRIASIAASPTVAGITFSGTEVTRRGRVGVLATAAATVALAPAVIRRERDEYAAPHYGFQRRLEQLVGRLPSDRPLVVFVRYAPNHDTDASAIMNEPDLSASRVWRVYDRGGEENARLLRLVPDREPFLYDEARDTILPY